MLTQKDIEKMIKEGKDIYLAIVYCKDCTIHVMPTASKEDAFRYLLKMRGRPETAERMAATTISKRAGATYGDGKIFGAPKSLDVMQLTEKQFANACAAAKITTDGHELPDDVDF